MRSPLRRHKTWDLFSCSSPMRSVFRAVCDGSGKNYTNSRAIANLPVQINCQSFGILSRCKSATDEAARRLANAARTRACREGLLPAGQWAEDIQILSVQFSMTLR